MKQYDRTYVEIDLEAIRHNMRQTRKNIKQDTKIMAIVKADAYGHGAKQVSKAIDDLVDAYGVALVEEAIELREAGIRKMILILGYTGEIEFEDVIRYDISQTVYTYEMAELLNAEAQKAGKKAKIHIKLDTGMGRIGFALTEDNIEVIGKIAKMPFIEMEGVFTHFARADETSAEPAREAFLRYQEYVKRLEQAGISFAIKHASNSAGIINLPEANLSMVRSGISTYGLYPSEEVTKECLHLQPAMEWKTKVSFVKTVEKGMSISYGGTFTADKTMRVATVPIGYADGMKRSLSNCGRVLIHGCYANILGRVCMDQFMVDVTDIPDVSIGDIVTIFGKDGGKVIPVEEIAHKAGSFNYEFICSITGRVPRKYKNE